MTNTKDSGTSLVSDFDLDSLVEEVAVILHTGRKAYVPASSLASETAIAALSFQTASRITRNGDELSVIVNIEQSSSWNIRSVAGAWRRIVMNLLGNAMKWTQTGLIEVSLSQAAAQTEAEPHLVHLRVTDTGRGIAQDFLRNSAFSPFAQEDALSEGVGLGLSVVHKLVTFLGGHLNMKSEIGVGTQVDVYIPAQRPKDHVPAKLFDNACSIGMQSHKDTLKACLIGFNGYPDLTETPTGILSSDAKRKLSIQSTLANVFRVQPGWHIALAESLEKGEGDIAVIEEAKFNAMLNDQSPSTMDGGHNFKFFIVLGSTTSSLGHSLPPNAILISQPYVQGSPLLRILELTFDADMDLRRSVKPLKESWICTSHRLKSTILKLQFPLHRHVKLFPQTLPQRTYRKYRKIFHNSLQLNWSVQVLLSGAHRFNRMVK